MLQSVDCCVVTRVSFDIIEADSACWRDTYHYYQLIMSLNDDDDEEVLDLVL